MPKKATKKVEQDKSPDKKRNATDKVRENLYLPASYLLELRRTLIPFSPAYDSVLGGGIVSGSMTTMASAPKCGKTSSLLHLCATCQRPEYGGRYWDKDAVKDTDNKPGRPVFFYSTENRLTKRDLSLPGLDLSQDKFKLIVTTDKKTLYLEQFFENIEQTIDLYPGCVILVDSIGSLCSEKVAEATEGGQVRDPAPLLSSFFMKRIGQLLMAKDIIMLNVLHKVTNTGAKPGQATKQTTGGEKIKYGANNIIEITWSETSRDDKDCMILHLLGKTSELGPPDEKADGCLRLGKGLWDSYELVAMCTVADTNHLYNIHKEGSWYTIDSELTGDKAAKIQGIISVARWFDEHRAAYKKVYKKYSDMQFTNRKLYS